MNRGLESELNYRRKRARYWPNYDEEAFIIKLCFPPDRCRREYEFRFGSHFSAPIYPSIHPLSPSHGAISFVRRGEQRAQK